MSPRALLLIAVLVPTTAAAGSMTTVAVAPLSSADEDGAWVGVALAEALSQRLFARAELGSLTVRQVLAAMRESRTTSAQLVKTSAARELGRHLGADLLLTGDYVLRGGKVEGSVRLVQIATGKVTSRKLVGEVANLAALEEGLRPLLDTIGGGREWPPMSLAPEAAEAASRALVLLRRQSLSPQAANALVPPALGPDELASAATLLAKASQQAPGDPSVQTAQALTSALQGNLAAAWQLTEKAAARPTPETILVRAFVRMREGRYDEAEKILRAAVQAHPGFLHGRASLAELLIHFGRLREARGAFQKYLELSPRQPWVLAQIGYCNARLGRLEQAIADTRRALDLVPSSAYLMTELASRQIDADDLPGAQKTLQRILEVSPDDARARVRLGYVQLLRGKDKDAIATSTKAIELAVGPHHRRDRAYAHVNLARAHGRAGKIDEAMSHLQRARQEAADVSFDEIDLDPRLERVRRDPRYAALGGAAPAP